MKTIFKLIAAVMFAQAVQATPITGSIDFSGTVLLDSGVVGTSTQATGWGNAAVSSTSETLAAVLGGTAVSLAPSWLFNAGPVQDFWSVGGFTFNLYSSAIYAQDTSYLSVILTGNVTGNGYSPTTFTGKFQINQQPVDGVTTFTEHLAFDGVPDLGMTAMLLGASFCSLVIIRRKWCF